MKLSFLYEYLDPYGPGVAFYGDPLWKNKTKGSGNTSHLVGGSKDRDKFLRKMNKKKGRKRKKKKK